MIRSSHLYYLLTDLSNKMLFHEVTEFFQRVAEGDLGVSLHEGSVLVTFYLFSKTAWA